MPTKSVIEVPSSGNLLYGTITHVTDRGLMIVLTSHRRRWVETHRYRKKDGVSVKEVANRYMTDWEELRPERELCAWQGKFSLVLPPKEVGDGLHKAST